MRRRESHERVVRGALCRRIAHGAESLDTLPHGGFIDGKQGHDEVILLKCLSLRVHAHEDVRYGLLVSRFGNLQRRQKIALKPEQCVEPVLDGVLAVIVEFRFTLLGICLVKALYECPAISAQFVIVVRREGLGHIWHVTRVPLSRGVGILECARDGVVGDPHRTFPEVLISHGHAVQRAQESGEPLLSVDDKGLGDGICLLVRAYGRPLARVVARRVPQHHIADRVSAKHGIKQIANLFIAPHERPLQIRQANLARLNILQDITDLQRYGIVDRVGHYSSPTFSA